MRTRHSLALATGVVSALALIPASQAQAHGTSPAAAAAATSHVTSTRALLASLGSVPLDKLDAWAATLQAAAAAVPDGTVLRGRTRALARHQLAAAVATYARLGSLDGLTADQQAKVEVIQSRLSAAASSLRALLANVPAASVTVVPAKHLAGLLPTATVVRTHLCDGDHDGFRFGDASFRDGRDGDRHHRDGRHHR